MGTRNLVMVVKDNETKVAQYGQWDGYPSGVGLGVLAFLSKIDVAVLKEKLDSFTWLTDEQIEIINKSKDWVSDYPYLSRDASEEVLNAIYFGKMEVKDGIGKRKTIDIKVIGLQNNEDFAKDGLFCEWCYVIDLDKNKLEIYEGLSKEPFENNRFGVDKNEDGYYPVQFSHSFDLLKLPTQEEFISILEPKEEEE